MVKLDPIDRKILTELMRDATRSVAQIADRVGLTQTPCWKRIQRLEKEGVLTGRVATIDQARVGLGLTVFVGIEAFDHGGEWGNEFFRMIDEFPEVMEIHRVSGDIDYMLRVVVADMAAYNEFYRGLTGRLRIKNVTSRFAMETIRASTVYPLPGERPAAGRSGASIDHEMPLATAPAALNGEARPLLPRSPRSPTPLRNRP